MINKKIAINGDSMNNSMKTREKHKVKSANNAQYKYVEIRRSVGEPSVSRNEIVKAVRAVMQEDGLLKS